MHKLLIGVLILLTVPRSGVTAAVQSRQDLQTVVARVGNEEITEARLRLVALLANTPLNDTTRASLLRRLTENRLVEQALTRDGAKVSRSAVVQARKLAMDRLAARKRDARKELKALGLRDADLERELVIGLLWRQHTRRTISRDDLHKRFTERQHEFDGTRVAARQILLKADDDDSAQWKQAEQKLQALREQIVSGAISFEAAAKEHSQAPSAKNGGDVGVFPFSGRMPRVIAEQAFALKAGEVTQPFRSPFGVHLYQVTRRIPGDLSLEDARPAVFSQLEREMWQRTVDEEQRRGRTPSR